MRRKCKQCEERKEITEIASRKAGGSYNRANRYYPTALCLDCAKHLVSRIQPGSLTTDRWNNVSLKYAIAKMENEVRRSM